MLDTERNAVSAYSVKSISFLKKIEADKISSQNIDVTNLPQEDFSQEQLELFWKSYIQKIHDQGERVYASGLEMIRPERVNVNCIKLEFPSETVLQEFREKQDKLQQELFLVFRNFHIRFEFSVVPVSVVQKIPFSMEEKYARLLEINPHIGKLKETLRLDF